MFLCDFLEVQTRFQVAASLFVICALPLNNRYTRLGVSFASASLPYLQASLSVMSIRNAFPQYQHVYSKVAHSFLFFETLIAFRVLHWTGFNFQCFSFTVFHPTLINQLIKKISQVAVFFRFVFPVFYVLPFASPSLSKLPWASKRPGNSDRFVYKKC